MLLIFYIKILRKSCCWLTRVHSSALLLAIFCFESLGHGVLVSQLPLPLSMSEWAAGKPADVNFWEGSSPAFSNVEHGCESTGTVTMHDGEETDGKMKTPVQKTAERKVQGRASSQTTSLSSERDGLWVLGFKKICLFLFLREEGFRLHVCVCTTRAQVLTDLGSLVGSQLLDPLELEL